MTFSHFSMPFFHKMVVVIVGITCFDCPLGKVGTSAAFCQFSTLFLCLIYRFLKSQRLEYQDVQALRGSSGQENLCEEVLQALWVR